METKKTPEKPILLWCNEERIEYLLQKGKEAEDKLNDFIERAEKETEQKFTKAEKFKLKDDAPVFLLGWARSVYQFPKADDEFNQKAMGVDIPALSREFQKGQVEWNNFEMEYKDGRFHFVEKSIIEKFSFYAETERQKKVYQFSSKMAKLLNDGIAGGYVRESHAARICQVSMTLLKKGSNVEVNGRKIASFSYYKQPIGDSTDAD